MIGMEGKLEMMYPESKKPSKDLSTSKFKDFAKTHNAHVNAKK